MPPPPSILTLGTAEKASGDSNVRLPCDWGNDPAVIQLLTDANDNFLSSATAFTAFNVATSGAGAPTVSGVQLDRSYVLSAKVSGGSTGTYAITYSVTLNNPDATQLNRTGLIKVY